MFFGSASSSIFPVFLLPSVPFRRRKSNTDSSNTACSTDSDGTDHLPRSSLHENYLPGHASHLRCAKCAADVCLTSQIISKGFTGRHGRAYLVSPTPTAMSTPRTAVGGRTPGLPNTKTEAPSQRQLVTGIHTVSDVRCTFCGSLLGWKYEGAEEESQRYKLGKYILETKLVCSSSDWEQQDLGVPPASLQSGEEALNREFSSVEFDSQDEDECEDLFAGIWSPALAMKRRQNKNFRKAVSDMEARSR